MKSLSFLFHLAVSLFVAPTPGLLLLMYANGGTTIPPLQGLVVLVLSAAGYWIWLSDRRSRKAVARRAERARAADPARPVDGLGGAGGLPSQPDEQLQLAAERRRQRDALRGHDDLRDPLAEQRQQAPAAVMIDRVADLRQLKSLVLQNENTLLNAFARSVKRDEYGAPDYSDWAYEADRFLMSSSFMARTLTRHEAIATVTAEIEFAASEARKPQAPALEPPRAPNPALLAHAAAPALPQMPAYPAAAGYLPDPAMQTGAVGAAMPPMAGRQISDSLKRRLLSRRGGRTFAAECAKVLTEHGWVTQATDSPGSDAIDLFAERGDLIVGLRCRQLSEPVDEDALAEVLAARDRFGLDAAGIVATAGVTTGARASATLNGICMLEESDLPDLHLFVGQRKKVVPLFRSKAQA